MATGFYLLDNKTASQQTRQRRETISGVLVVHTAESAPDTSGLDGGAEAVAEFIRGRSDYGSYHTLCDSDSIVRLLPFTMVAYGDATGTNDHAIHISAATQAHMWKRLSPEWRRGCIRNMARAASEASDALERVHGVRIPARRVTKEQSSNRVEGFISHGERDPGRRSDPGADFDWDLFFKFYREIEARKINKKKPGAKPSAKPGSLDDKVTIETRGRNLDTAHDLLSDALADLEDASGKGNRADDIAAAVHGTKAALKAIESVPLKEKVVAKK